jgi:energy-coupling factor transporter ATP-binding protein EcfA2
MITEIGIEGFKSLEKVDLKLGKLNLFVGANASGKSNFLDALRVLQGIGYGFTIAEIFNGKPKSASSEVWEGIRGGTARAKFAGPAETQSSDPLAFRVCLKAPRGSHVFSYSIHISTESGSIVSEGLKMDSMPLFETSEWADSAALAENSHKSGRPALHSLDRVLSLDQAEEKELEASRKLLSNMQRLSPSPEILRTYGQVLQADRIGEAGENFASLVKTILKSRNDRDAFTSWLQQLLGTEAEKVKILKGAKGEPLFALERGGTDFNADVLSDGTLRFAALVSAFFQPDMPDVITVEEIENGIHPGRIRLLLELLKSQSSEDGPQVFATTHSPVVLAWLEEEDYETTFFCKRDEESGASIIKPLSEIPHLVELVRKHSISDMFVEGWMEAAL